MSLLEYNIDNEKSYIGPIINISKKKDEVWVNNVAQDEVVIQLILLRPSIIERIELKPYKTEIVILQFISLENDIVHKEEFLIPQGHKSIIPKEIKINKPIIRVTLRLKAKQQAKRLGLNFLQLKGISEESKNQGIQNLSKQQKIDRSVQDSKFKRNERQIFDKRQKSLKKFDEQNDQGFKTYYQRTAKKGVSQDIEMEKAIKLSLEYQRNHKSSERNMIGQDIDEIEIPEDQPSRIVYPMRPFTQQHKKVFANANSAWVEAQRRAQNIYNVQEKHKLSRHIQVKHLYNKNICYDLFGQERIRLTKLAEEMGAKTIDEPADYCLLITRSRQNQKIAKGRMKNKVQILTPQFILQCKRMDAKLDENDYLHRL